MSVRITVRVTPRGGRDEIEGWAPGTAGERMLRVRVAAAPSGGAANDALVRLLAKRLGMPAASIRIAAGAASRTKIVEFEGVHSATLHALP